jgi:LysM repeat protein
MIKTIAFENQCGFWDWYIISGGSQSMNIWQENKLTMNDGIHLNGKGSELKGTLLIEALKNTIYYLKNSTENRELNYEYPKEIEPIKEDVISEIKQPIKVISKTIKKTYYTVKSGDNLGQIAEKFNISIIKLKKQNKVRGNLIFPKQKLLIK